jgi:hypothetical protein
MKAMRCLRRRFSDVVCRQLAATPRHPVGAPEVSASAPRTNHADTDQRRRTIENAWAAPQCQFECAVNGRGGRSQRHTDQAALWALSTPEPLTQRDMLWQRLRVRCAGSGNALAGSSPDRHR